MQGPDEGKYYAELNKTSEKCASNYYSAAPVARNYVPPASKKDNKPLINFKRGSVIHTHTHTLLALYFKPKATYWGTKILMRPFRAACKVATSNAVYARANEIFNCYSRAVLWQCFLALLGCVSLCVSFHTNDKYNAIKLTAIKVSAAAIQSGRKYL